VGSDDILVVVVVVEDGGSRIEWQCPSYVCNSYSIHPIPKVQVQEKPTAGRSERRVARAARVTRV
jgi:hypothetical protein